MSSSVSLQRLLPDVLWRPCLKNGIKTTNDILVRNELELVHLLDLELVDVQVCEKLAPKVRTMHELCNREYKSLSADMEALDGALKGGIPVGCITEFVGAPGVGKTQFCMTLSALCVLPVRMGGLGETAGVVYIDTEQKFSATRYDAAVTVDAEANLNALASRISVISVTNSEELAEHLGSLETTILEAGAKLVVIDSIAALARRDFGRSSIHQRQQQLSTHAAHLKYIAESLRIPVIVTNQVTSRFLRESDGPQSGGATLVPALGNTWAHCVNTRISLEMLQDGRRRLSVLKSPVSGPCRMFYSIRGEGIVADAVPTDTAADAVAPPRDALLSDEGDASAGVGGRSSSGGVGMGGGGSAPHHPSLQGGNTGGAFSAMNSSRYPFHPSSLGRLHTATFLRSSRYQQQRAVQPQGHPHTHGDGAAEDEHDLAQTAPKHMLAAAASPNPYKLYLATPVSHASTPLSTEASTADCLTGSSTSSGNPYKQYHHPAPETPGLQSEEPAHKRPRQQAASSPHAPQSHTPHPGGVHSVSVGIARATTSSPRLKACVIARPGPSSSSTPVSMPTTSTPRWKRTAAMGAPADPVAAVQRTKPSVSTPRGRR